MHIELPSQDDLDLIEAEHQRRAEERFLRLRILDLEDHLRALDTILED